MPYAKKKEVGPEGPVLLLKELFDEELDVFVAEICQCDGITAHHVDTRGVAGDTVSGYVLAVYPHHIRGSAELDEIFIAAVDGQHSSLLRLWFSSRK